LNEKVEGVVTTYDKPFSKNDHEAITDNIPVMGEVKKGRVVYAYQEDADRGSDIRVKKKK
jgi:branched-chain amino acid transport system substrate-binding protein